MKQADVWKLQDAKARFSELVRRARSGPPQEVTVHGRKAVLVIDPERFEVRAKPRQEKTLAGFVERSKKYRGAAEGVEFERALEMTWRDKRSEIFDEDVHDKDEP
jgi:prevent-host-death family protein